MTFPFAQQIATLERKRQGKKKEKVCLITSLSADKLSPKGCIGYNKDHWAIETGLHARLDASRHDDRCRLRNEKPLRLHACFTRIANSTRVIR